MIPTIDRFMGALQGMLADLPPEEGELLDLTENLLANGGLNVKDLGRLFACDPHGEKQALTPLLRAIPVGLFYYKEIDRLQEATEKVCRLSHGEPEDIAAAVAMALATARLLRMGELEPLLFIREIAWFVRRIEPTAYESLLELLPVVEGKVGWEANDLAAPLAVFQAGLLIFLLSTDGDLPTVAHSMGLAGTPAVSVAYSLAGSFGRICRMEKPPLRVVMIAEELQKNPN